MDPLRHDIMYMEVIAQKRRGGNVQFDVQR